MLCLPLTQRKPQQRPRTAAPTAQRAELEGSRRRGARERRPTAPRVQCCHPSGPWLSDRLLYVLAAQMNARRAFRSIDEWHAEQWEQLRVEDRKATTGKGTMDSMDE